MRGPLDRSVGWTRILPFLQLTSMEPLGCVVIYGGDVHSMPVEGIHSFHSAAPGGDRRAEETGLAFVPDAEVWLLSALPRAAGGRGDGVASMAGAVPSVVGAVPSTIRVASGTFVVPRMVEVVRTAVWGYGPCVF